MSKYLDKNLIKDLLLRQCDFSKVKMFLLTSILNEKLTDTELTLTAFKDGRHKPGHIVKIKQFAVTKIKSVSEYDARVNRSPWRITIVIDEPDIVNERAPLLPYHTFIDTAIDVLNIGFVPKVNPQWIEYSLTEDGWEMLTETSHAVLETWTSLLSTDIPKPRYFEPGTVVVEKPNHDDGRLVSVETFTVVCCIAPMLLQESAYGDMGAMVDTIVRPIENVFDRSNRYMNGANLITIAEYFELVKEFSKTPFAQTPPPIRDNWMFTELCEMFSQCDSVKASDLINPHGL